MKRFYSLFALFMLVAGTMSAQRIMSIGEQVTDASSLNTTDHYVIKLVSYYVDATEKTATDNLYFYTTGGRMKASTIDTSVATASNTTNNFLINLRTPSTETEGVFAVGMGTYYIPSFTSGSGGFNTQASKGSWGYKFVSNDDGSFKMQGYVGASAGYFLNYNPSTNSGQTEVTTTSATAMNVKIYKANTNIEENKLYNLHIRGNGTSQNVVFDNALYTATRTSAVTDASGVWYFKKDQNSLCRWYMCNAAADDSYGITAITTNNSPTYLSQTPTSFKAANGDASFISSGGFSLILSNNATINDVAGTLGIWNDESAPTDGGSTFIPTDVTSSYALCTFNFVDTENNINVVRKNYQQVGNTPVVPYVPFFTQSSTQESLAVSATEENAYTVTGTFSYPFKESTSDNDANWYSMRVRLLQSSGRDVMINSDSHISSRVVFTNQATSYSRFNDGLFCFIRQDKTVNFKIKSRSGKYLKWNGGAAGSAWLLTTNNESEATAFMIRNSTYNGAATTDFCIVPAYAKETSSYVCGDHNGNYLSSWSGGSGVSDDGSRFAIKAADETADILSLGATLKANEMAAAAPNTYVGGYTDSAIAAFKTASYSGLSDLETKATAYADDDNNLQKPSTDKLYTLRFTRYGSSNPVYAAFKNATADKDGNVNMGDDANSTPSERLIGFSATQGTSAIVRFVANGDYYNIQDVNSGLYYGSHGDNQSVYAVKETQYAGNYSVVNTINGTAAIVALKDNKSADNIQNQYLFCCGDDASSATTTYDYLQFHSPYTNNVTTGDKTTIEPGVLMQIEELSTYPITISEAGYASLCLPFSVTLPEGVTANKVTAVTGDNKEITLEAISGTIAAGEPVILQGSAADYTLTINAEEGTKTTDNILTGASVKRTGITDTYYALGYKALTDGNDTKTAGFYRVTTGNMPANKAYLLKSSIPAEAQQAMMFSFNFGGNSTGINQAATTQTESNVYYDLNGRRVLYPTRGIYVKANGQKVFIK